jgi:hypothetical protein
LATASEIAADGYLEDAVVPNRALPVEPEHLDLLRPYLADVDTPSGLCLGFGAAAVPKPMLERVRKEAGDKDFQPHHGSHYVVDSFKGRLVDVLTAQPGSMTTTRLDPRIAHYSETRKGDKVGMHYDNALTSSGTGERFPAAVRVDAADRRLLYNIGPGARRLVVALNLTAPELSERVRPGDDRNIPDSRQLQTYLRAHPSEVESVVCLVTTLYPGDYAVFPAGIAIHDGSMDGCTEESSAIVLAGKFPRARPEVAASQSG